MFYIGKIRVPNKEAINDFGSPKPSMYFYVGLYDPPLPGFVHTSTSSFSHQWTNTSFNPSWASLDGVPSKVSSVTLPFSNMLRHWNDGCSSIE